MSSIQKRLYTVLPRVTPSSPTPRVRSNSISSQRSLYTSSVLPLSFFDSPPPPSTSRPVLSPPHRLPAEAKAELQVNSLALTAPHSAPNVSLALAHNHAPYSSTPRPPLAIALSSPDHVPRLKRHRTKYHLDVGAYGIPKRRTKRRFQPRTHQTHEDLSLAVQVGEDAYFVRDNAMGVADGVGGWSRNTRTSSSHPSPSALFARRLMHFCSAQVDSASDISSAPPPPPLKSYSNPPLPLNSVPWYWNDFSAFESLSSNSSQWNDHSIEESLEDSLQELSEGIDVLQILEQAYDKTIKAHVIPAASDPSSNSTVSSCQQLPDATVPLLSGSSTALVAVLDHISTASSSTSTPSPASSSTSSQPSVSISSAPDSLKNYAAGLLSNCTLEPASSQTSTGANASLDEYDAVIKIAHIGDCMGMLVRGDQIAWRSEEMWWNFNTPVQLGPTTPTTPLQSAHSFALPVKADDILILASDGLSDNLWDEDVLDEVIRFRKSYLDDQPKNVRTASGSESDNEGRPQSAQESKCSTEGLLRRRTLAGMLSEALCSRARRVAERGAGAISSAAHVRQEAVKLVSDHSDPIRASSHSKLQEAVDLGEVPFARRAREAGKVFHGGKDDDISVIVAVISPSADLQEQAVAA